MYEHTDMKFAKGYFHWFYLIQPAPLPEKMIMADPKRWLKSRFNRSSKLAVGRVEEEYFRAFKQKKRIHATCEDYRAAATIDLKHDKKDRKKKLNIPIQVLWGKRGVVGTQFKSVKIWQKYTNKKVYGVEINSDHFIPEESPKQTTNHLKIFFLKNVKTVSYTHLRAHETGRNLVCRLLLEKKNKYSNTSFVGKKGSCWNAI